MSDTPDAPARTRWNWNTVAAVVSALAAVGGLIFVGIQNKKLTDSIQLQTTALELENRPYLYVDIQPQVTAKPIQRESAELFWDLYLGAKLVFKNVGNTPATNIRTELRMYNDADKTDDAARLEQWYIDQFGYFPHITTVFPEQTGQEVGLFVDAGEGATKYLISIRITYTGEDTTKQYWYSSDVRYRIERDSVKEIRMRGEQNGMIVELPVRKEYGVWLLESNSDYDAIRNRHMPPAKSNPYSP